MDVVNEISSGHSTSDASEINAKQSLADESSKLLALIDSEIAIVLDAKRQRGWTAWALTAGVGTLLWLGATEIENPSISWPNVIAVFIAFQLCFYAFFISKAVVLGNQGSYRRGRFHLVPPELVSILIFEGLKAAAIIALAVWSSLKVPSWSLTIVIIFLSVFILFSVGVLILRHLGIPMEQKRVRGVVLLCSLAISSLLFLSAWYFIQATSGLKVLDTKIAGIVSAILLLLEYGARLNFGDTFLTSMSRLRRQLALDKIDYPSARAQVEIILEGMRGQDIVAYDVQEYIDLYGVANEVAHEQIEILKSAIKDLPVDNGKLTPDQIARYKFLLKTFSLKEVERVLDEIEARIGRSKRVYSSLNLHFSLIISNSHPSLWDKMTAVRQNLKQMVREAHSYNDKLTALLKNQV